MIFQLILHVLLTPTNFCFHDQVITSLPGVLGITGSPLNIGIYLYWNELRNAGLSFPQPGSNKEYETNICFFYILFPERHRDSDMLSRACLHTLLKPWEYFMFSTISSIRNMSKHKAQFIYLFVSNLTFIFMWVQLMTYHLKIRKKRWPLTIDHSGENEDSISFFIFSYLQWNMITTELTSICEI